MIGRNWKVYIAVVGGFSVLVFCLATHDKTVRLSGFGWIPAMSFAEVKGARPFVAVVESKMHGIWGAPVDSSTGKPGAGAKPTEYIMVYLRKADGKRLG